MSVENTLGGIWEDFKEARRKPVDLEKMRLCLKEFELEYNSTILPNHRIQKHSARRAVMRRSIERAGAEPTFNTEEAGTW